MQLSEHHLKILFDFKELLNSNEEINDFYYPGQEIVPREVDGMGVFLLRLQNGHSLRILTLESDGKVKIDGKEIDFSGIRNGGE